MTGLGGLCVYGVWRKQGINEQWGWDVQLRMSRARWAQVRGRVRPVPPTLLPSPPYGRPHTGEHTPRPDELLQHGCHLLWAHVAQAADGDGWNGRGTRQAT